MEIYITLKNELVLTNSKQKKSIERHDFDQIKLPWLKLGKRVNLWELEEFSAGKKHSVAFSPDLRKLVVPLMRRIRFLFGRSRLPEIVEMTLTNWVDKNR